MIAIVDYGMGNLKSVLNAFLYLGSDAIITTDKNDIDSATHIVIPGVGSFEKCISNLKYSDFFDTLSKNVLELKKPTLGICVGLQIMSKLGFENGEWEGLSWVDAEVIKIKGENHNARVPNIGWNETTINTPNHPVLKDIKSNSDFYYVHSYYLKCKNLKDIAMQYQYAGLQITAAIAKDNIFATQFHPEKSQDIGLKLIENFIDWNPSINE